MVSMLYFPVQLAMNQARWTVPGPKMAAPAPILAAVVALAAVVPGGPNAPDIRYRSPTSFSTLDGFVFAALDPKLPIFITAASMITV